ncbi:EAL domain-containing protein [Oscillatoria amoena NRMC-F 0135]|nr:EAL domain-containing protein [Oscillatoria amoena NRMC-F 0135]
MLGNDFVAETTQEENSLDRLTAPILWQCSREGECALARALQVRHEIFRAKSIVETLGILGECEALGTPLGLIILTALEGATVEEELVTLRQIRESAELPIVVLYDEKGSSKVVDWMRSGASDCLPLWAETNYLQLRIEQYLQQSRRVWNLIEDQRNAEKLLAQQRSAMFLKDLWHLDLASRTIEFNENCQELAGHNPAILGAQLDNWLALVHPLDLDRLSKALSETDWQVSPNELSFEFRLKELDGGWRWILLRASLEKDETGHPIGLIGNHTDITEAKTIDNVTGLPNRFYLEDWLVQASQRKEASPQGLSGLNRNCALTLFLFGLDRFHLFLDSLGAPLTDQLVRLLGERLREIAKGLPELENTVKLIARTASDEFALAICGELQSTPEDLARQIEGQLGKGVWLDGKDIFTSFSCGYAQKELKNVGEDFEPREIWRNVQIAMHTARLHGGGRFVAFDESLRKRTIEAMHLENEMNRAIENWEFEVYYQPKVTLRQNRVVGFEALLRWRHPEKGIIPPSQFISIAEANGLIVPLGIRTVREACETLSRWQKEFPQDPPLEMSVNLSVRQFRDAHLIEEVKQILKETAIIPQSLQFEVTESVLVDEPERALSIVEELRALGVGIKIDDFGTGYSSLSYLHRLPFDSLKIDKSFINSMTKDHTAFEIVRAIVSLADNLGLHVVAEGI